MLFRLKMSIDAAIDSYRQLSEQIFSEKKWFYQDGKYKARRFEEAIQNIIRTVPTKDGIEAFLLKEDGPKWYSDGPYTI